MYAGIDRHGFQSVVYVLVDPRDGEPFFVGDCAYESLTKPYRERFGAAFATTVTDLARRGFDAPDPAEATKPVLNAGVTDPQVLARLRLAGVEFRIPASWRGAAYSLGTVVPEGMNDAVALNGAFGDEGELPDVPAYLPGDGDVEVWLRTLDANPVGALLGAVPVTAWGPDTDDDILRITIETAQSAAKAATAPKVTLTTSLAGRS